MPTVPSPVEPSPSSGTTAVIGGGIAGISAALALSSGGETVHLFERTSSLGGKIGETVVGDVTIPTGPDAFLARRTEVTDLAVELGLGDRLISPTAGSARIYRDGALHPLPPNVLGIPATDDLATSGLISPEGASRAAQDRTAPDDRVHADESVGSLVRRRLGDEVLEYLVDPLLGGINAGDSDRLSVEAGVPQISQLREMRPSLLAAAEATLANRPTNPPPVFSSVQGGLSRLVDEAEAVLRQRENVSVHTDTEARLVPSSTGWMVDSHAVDRVVIATPAFAAADLLRGFSDELADELASIDYSSVAVALLVLPAKTLPIDPSISGVLIPRLCGHHVTAISFASHKWPDMAGDDRQLLRVSVGRREDTRWLDMTDERLLQVILDDVAAVLGQAIPPGPSAIARWPQSLPQYDVDHSHRVARIDELTSSLPGLSFVGAWRHGLGLPACVASGRSAAEQG